MDPKHKKILQSNHNILVENVTYKEISTHLITLNVISTDKDEEFSEEKGNAAKVMTYE